MRPKLSPVLRYAITDRYLGPSAPEIGTPEALHRLLQRCAALAPTGLDFLLVREKNLPAATLLPLVRAVVDTFRHTATRILVAQRADIALAASAHGVHLSASPGELTPAEVRQVFPAAFVSRSCHTLDEVRQARRDRNDAILFGPIFGKSVSGRQVSPALGLATLRHACIAAGDTPVFALGGVTFQNAPQCLTAGAAGIAAIRMFFEAVEDS